MRAALGFFGAVALTICGCANHRANETPQKALPPPPPTGQIDSSGKVAIVEKFSQVPGKCAFIRAVDTTACAGPNMTQCMASKVAAYGGNLMVLDGDRSLAYRCETPPPCDPVAPC